MLSFVINMKVYQAIENWGNQDPEEYGFLIEVIPELYSKECLTFSSMYDQSFVDDDNFLGDFK
jgi:hypothetical protein